MPQPLKLLPPALKIDRGRVRSINADWAEYEIPQDPDTLARKGALFVLADGMGGEGEAQLASRTAVKMAISTYYAALSPGVEASLVRAFEAANTEVHLMQSQKPGERTLGTTMVAAVIRGDRLYIAHVGDSRAYLVRGNAIRQLTQDHSFVAEQQRAGLLTEQQARLHPQHGVLTRAIGADPDVQVDTSKHILQPGDAVVLCSDGLTGQVKDEEIRKHVISLPPREAAQRLIDTANRRGGPDNISVLIVKSQAPPSAGLQLPAGPLIGLAFALFLILLTVLAVWRATRPRPQSTPPAVVVPGPSPTQGPAQTPTPEKTPAGIAGPTATLRHTPAWTLTLTTGRPTQTPTLQPTTPSAGGQRPAQPTSAQPTAAPASPTPAPPAQATQPPPTATTAPASPTSILPAPTIPQIPVLPSPTKEM